MHNLVRYCGDKGFDKFIRFKFERKSKFIMVEHFVSNDDVRKYGLHLYVNRDRFGRYKLSKYVSKKLSFICEFMLHNGNESDIIYILQDIDKNINKSIYKQRLQKLKKLNV